MALIRLNLLIIVFAMFGTASAQQNDAATYFREDVSLDEIPRYYALPTRFLLRFEFQPVKQNLFFQDEYRQLFVRILNDTNSDELHFKAARSLERVGREKLTAAETYAEALRERLSATNDVEVRRACATALVAADSIDDAAVLAALCKPGDEVLCSTIEPWLARRKSAALQATWESRITSPASVSHKLLVLACDGAAALEKTNLVPQLVEFANSGHTMFAVRRAAARSVASLAPNDALTPATRLAAGGIQDKLIATTLLHADKSDAGLKLIATLCDDKDDAVASSAWASLVQLDPDRLVPKLAAGQNHRDPEIRFATIQTFEKLPSLERCDRLTEMCADTHIGVRNEARRTLQRLALSDDSLRDRILANAGDVSAKANATWQQIEQSLLLLGVMRHDAFQDNLIALLTHERPEVLVTAAWLLHLMPQERLGEPAVQEAVAKWKQIQAGGMPADTIDVYSLQIAFICEVAARTNARSIIDLCKDQYSKDVPLSPETRAIALWSLGVLMTDSEDDDLRKKYTERLFDDSPFNPEMNVVRAASAISMGLLGNKAAIADLKKGQTKFGGDGLVGRALSTALKRFGEEHLPTTTSVDTSIGGWPVGPAKPVEE